MSKKIYGTTVTTPINPEKIVPDSFVRCDAQTLTAEQKAQARENIDAMPANTEIPAVPTNVSAFENDAGYLTQHQDLSEYAKKEELPTVPSKLPNPHVLTINGWEYDGSASVDISITVDDGDAIEGAVLYARQQSLNDGQKAQARENISATPAGFGYGDVMQWLGFDAGTWASTGTFQADLEAAFAAMPQGTCKQVQFIDTNLNTQKFTGTLWRYTSSYGVLTAINYSGLKAVKTYYNGTWEEWEWENPPITTGTQYRTTQRYDGKPVYAKNISFGALPKNTEKTVEHGLSGGQIDTIVSFDVFAYETGSTVVRKLPFFTTSGSLRADGYITGARVGVVTQADMSGYTAIVQIRYTRK